MNTPVFVNGIRCQSGHSLTQVSLYLAKQEKWFTTMYFLPSSPEDCSQTQNKAVWVGKWVTSFFPLLVKSSSHFSPVKPSSTAALLLALPLTYNGEANFSLICSQLKFPRSSYKDNCGLFKPQCVSRQDARVESGIRWRPRFSWSLAVLKTLNSVVGASLACTRVADMIALL